MNLLERDLFQHELSAALHDVAMGEGRIALVSGEAGVGKTALIEQFVRARDSRVRVLWGVCDALFTPRPLGPLHDMAPQARGDLSALLGADATRTETFSAVLRELHGAPVIIVFEDVHWADEATLDLLRFLGRRIARTTALLVLTFRDDELGARHPLRSVLGDLVAAPATRRIPLPALSEHAVHTLIGERPIDAATLYRQTGGNPFFITEVLANEGGLPATIRDAVLARAARLSPSAQAVLQAAAVIGPRIEPWTLAEITRAEAQSVEACLDNGMLVAQGATLSFRHELVRQTVLESISPPQRIALHRMTLEALKRSPTVRTDLALLAHHAAGAHDRMAVLKYVPAAARQASAGNAHRKAATLYALALQFAADLPPAEHAGLLELCAEECHAIDQQDIGLIHLREALMLWRMVGDQVREGAILAQLASMLIGLGQDAEAATCAAQAITVLERQPHSSELARAYCVQATLDMIHHKPHTSIAWAEKSIVLAEQVADSMEQFSAQNIIGSINMFLDYERGCRHLEQNLAAAQAADHKAMAVQAYAQLGSNASELHHFRQAEQYLDEGLAFASHHDFDRLRFYMLAWQGWTRLHLGAWNEADEVAGAVGRDNNTATPSRLMALVTQARLRTRRGDSHVTVVLEEAREIARHMRTIDRLGPLQAVRAEAAWDSGDREQTLAAARAAYDLALKSQHAWYVGELAFWRWRAGENVALPDWTAQPFALQIAGDWRRAANEWERLACPYEQARALTDGDAAARLIALELFERLGAQPAAQSLRQTLRASGAANLPRKPRAATRNNPFGLTARELDILQLLIERLSNSEIATRCYISPKTVDHHVSAVLVKLNVHSRAAAAAVARQHALLAQI
ncbi:MAG: AAA family ATPase [Chloroflexales bacterium]|nr:AAA family ATPase [Chloroflexales bacterium]